MVGHKAQSLRSGVWASPYCIHHIGISEEVRPPQDSPPYHIQMAGADDWCFLYDLPDSHYLFPPHIAVTSLRPDAFFYSNILKRCILAELTSPWEDRVVDSSIKKTARYSKLQAEISEAGWTCELHDYL